MKYPAIHLVLSLLLLHPAYGNADEVKGRHHTFRYQTDYGLAHEIKTITFSPDGRQLALYAQSRIKFINTEVGETTGEYHFRAFNIGYSKDGARLLMIGEYGRGVLDTDLGTEIPFKYQEQPGYVGLSLEQRNGKLLIKTISPGGPVAALERVQVGDELIAVGQGQAGYMNKVTGSTVKGAIDLLKGPASTYLRLEVIPKGQLQSETHVIRRHPGTVVGQQIKFQPIKPSKIDDNLVWCVVDGRHQLSSAATGQPVAFLSTVDIENVGQYALSRDSKKFAVIARLRKGKGQGFAVEVFDTSTQERIAYIPCEFDNYSQLRFTPDGKQVLVAARYFVEVLDIERRRPVHRLTLGWNPPEKREDDRKDGGGIGRVVINSVADEVGNIGFSEGPTRVSLVDISPKGIVATGDPSGNVKLWDFKTGKLLETMVTDSSEEVKTLLFSPDGRWLAYHVEGVLHLADVNYVQPPPESAAIDLVQNSEKVPVEAPGAGPPLPEAAGPPLPEETAAWRPAAGASAEVKSRGRWYPAVIVKSMGEDRWHIHYDDSPEDWDEIVEGRRLRAAATAK